MEHVTGLVRERTKTEILLTAAEAYPAFERAVLAARSEIWASFRVFDPKTRLRSPEGRQVGETWFDLLVDALRRGVAVHLAVTDFDPVAFPSLHRGAWASLRRLTAASEAAGPRAAPLRAVAALHPAMTGILPRAVTWPRSALSLRRTAAWLNAQEAPRRKALLRDMPGLARLLRQGADGRVRTWPWGLPRTHPATHQQRLAVLDRRRLYIGGLDLGEPPQGAPGPDRPGGETWHDLQLMIEGPVVAEAQAHLESFLAVTAGRAEPLPQKRLLRTMSRPRPLSPATFGPETVAQEILDAHEMLAGRAERLIYLQTQAFCDIGLARRLARAGRERPELGLILVLPAASAGPGGRSLLDARVGAYRQARCLRILERDFGPRLFVGGGAPPRRAPAGTEAAGRDRGPRAGIHAKVSIFDDAAAIVSSADLDGRSLRCDTQAGVYLTSAPDVRGLRERVMRPWLPEDPDPRCFDPAQAATVWRHLALRNARRAPDRREGLILPYDLEATERLGRALPGGSAAMI